MKREDIINAILTGVAIGVSMGVLLLIEIVTFKRWFI